MKQTNQDVGVDEDVIELSKSQAQAAANANPNVKRGDAWQASGKIISSLKQPPPAFGTSSSRALAHHSTAPPVFKRENNALFDQRLDPRVIAPGQGLVMTPAVYKTNAQRNNPRLAMTTLSISHQLADLKAKSSAPAFSNCTAMAVKSKTPQF